jgi:hypothetical protein
VAEVLGFVGLTGYEERMPSALSGGQRRRVGIARAMASKPRPAALRRSHLRSSTGDRQQRGRRDREAARSGARDVDLRHAPDSATRSTWRGTRRSKNGGGIDIRESATERARFLVLHEGRIFFEGTGAELLAAHDATSKSSCS